MFIEDRSFVVRTKLVFCNSLKQLWIDSFTRPFAIELVHTDTDGTNSTRQGICYSQIVTSVIQVALDAPLRALKASLKFVFHRFTRRKSNFWKGPITRRAHCFTLVNVVETEHSVMYSWNILSGFLRKFMFLWARLCTKICSIRQILYRNRRCSI